MTRETPVDRARLPEPQERLRTSFRSAIKDLRSANRHHDFERLCVAHARQRFDPSLSESVGPVSAGGDRGRDGFSRWTALDEDAASFAATFQPPGTTTTVVACTTTLPDRLPDKLKSDVTQILSDSLPCGRILYYTVESLSETQWSRASDRVDVAGVDIYYRRPELFAAAARRTPDSISTRAVELVIIDGSMLADDLSRPEFAALAIDVLRLPPALLPMQHTLTDIHAVVRARALSAMGRLDDEQSAVRFHSALETELAELTCPDATNTQIQELRTLLADVEEGWRYPFIIDVTGDNSAQRRSDAAIRTLWDNAIHRLDTCEAVCGTQRPTRAVPLAREIGWAGELLGAIDELSTGCDEVGRALDESAQSAVGVPRRRRIFDVRRRLDSVQGAIASLRRRLRAEACGVVLIEGGWGTGKTYHAAQFALDRIEQGAPTVFVNGAMWRGSTRSWLTELARSVDTGISGREFLDGLRLHAEASGHRAVIIVDAVNEAAPAHWPGQLAELAARVAPCPEITLIATRRNDEGTPTSRPNARQSPWAIYPHRGVDPAQAWQILRRSFDLPPVAAPWTIPDYRRPLVLRMFARVHSGSSADAVAPMALGDLFASWIALLSHDFAAQHPSHSPGMYDRGELQVVLRHLDSRPGQAVTREQIRRNADGLSSAEVDRAVDFLCYEGVLVDTEGRLEYGLQRIAEFRHAQALLDARLRRAPSAPRRRARRKWTDPDPITLAMAELSPAHSGHEVLRGPAWAWRAGMPEAFILSLQGRSISTVSPTTVTLARKMLAVPARRLAIWMFAIHNSVTAGHPLGARFIDEELTRTPPTQRAQQWIEVLHAIATFDAEEEEDSDLAAILVWINRRADTNTLDPIHAGELARMLMWWLALPPGETAASATRTLAAVLAAQPHLAASLLVHARACGDVDIYAGVWNAVYGAITRATATSAAETLALAAHDQFRTRHATAGSLTMHLRLHVALYRALHAAGQVLDTKVCPPTLHELTCAYASVSRVRWSHRRVGAHSDHIAVGPLRELHERFADDSTTGFDEQVGRAAQLLAEVAAQHAIPYRDRLRLRHQSVSVRKKLNDQAIQMWLAELSARHRYHDQLHRINGRWEPPPAGSGRWLGPDDGYDELPDPTIDLEVPLYAAGSIDRRDAGKLPIPAAVYDPTGCHDTIDGADFSFIEPDGSRWWVLAGEFVIENRACSPPVNLGQLINSAPDTPTASQVRPALTRTRNTTQVRLRSWLVHSATGKSSSLPLPASAGDFAAAEWDTLAQAMTCPPPTGADARVIASTCYYFNPGPQPDRFMLIVPTAQFRALLDLTWTGRQVTCTDPHGDVLQQQSIADTYMLPFVAISDGLRTRISQQGYRIAWETTPFHERNGFDETSTHRYWLDHS